MLKLIAPFRAAFNLDSSLAAAKPADFSEFLSLAQREFDNPESPIRKHIPPALAIKVSSPAAEGDNHTAYRFLGFNRNGSQCFLPNIFTLHFQHSEADAIGKICTEAGMAADKEVKPYSRFFSPDIGSLRVDLQDNTIAILSVELVVGHNVLPKGDHIWDRLDDWTVHFMQHLLSELYKKYIFPFLTAVIRFSKESGYSFIHNMEQYAVFSDVLGDGKNLEQKCALMWVNRTLCYNSENYPSNNWIAPLMRGRDVLRIQNAEAHINPGNSVIIMPDDMDKKHLAPFWEVMRIAQYYYAAMDVVNINLVQYIGVTFNHKSSKTLNKLSSEMEKIINAVTILLLHYHDLGMEMQGVSRSVFQALQKEWNFSLIAGNVQKKLELCKSNITMLNQETQKRNQVRTEIVLTSLTGMGVLNLCVELGSYATQLPPEHANMVGKIPGFMDLGFIMSGNALSWIGLAIAVSVIFFTVKNRLG